MGEISRNKSMPFLNFFTNPSQLLQKQAMGSRKSGVVQLYDVALNYNYDCVQGSGKMVNEYQAPEEAQEGCLMALLTTYRYHQLSMEYTHTDCTIMSNFLKDTYHFLDENIHIMKDDESYWNTPGYYLESSGTIERLLDLACKTKERDSLVYYVSGHGSEKGIVTPTDILIAKNLQKVVKAIHPGCKATFVMDCCYAGGVIELASPNLVILAACQPDELAYGGEHGSFFTVEMTKAAERRAQANMKTDYIELINDVNASFVTNFCAQRAGVYGPDEKVKSTIFV